MKKNGFLTFCFAFVPGAGQMYLGYMKRGISIMGLFALCIVLISTFSFMLFPMMAVVVWFAAFFDTFRLAHVLQDQELKTDDDWLWNSTDAAVKKIPLNQHRAVGIVLIVLGAWLCLEQLLPLFGRLGLDVSVAAEWMQHYLPAFGISALLIWFGLRFISGPQKPKDRDAEGFMYQTQETSAAKGNDKG